MSHLHAADDLSDTVKTKLCLSFYIFSHSTRCSTDAFAAEC